MYRRALGARGVRGRTRTRWSPSALPLAGTTGGRPRCAGCTGWSPAPSGRLVGRYGFRTRIATADWDPVPLSPVAAVPLIAPAPLLLVHGDRDPYFPLDHPRMLAEAAGPGGAELWLERGMGHAENAADDALLARIADWATAAPRA